MNIFGLHTFAIAPTWDLDRIERRVEELKEYGIGLFEIPLPRPEEIDTRAQPGVCQPPGRRARRLAGPAARPRHRRAAG
jgi:hypothetical protein